MIQSGSKTCRLVGCVVVIQSGSKTCRLVGCVVVILSGSKTCRLVGCVVVILSGSKTCRLVNDDVPSTHTLYTMNIVTSANHEREHLQTT